MREKNSFVQTHDCRVRERRWPAATEMKQQILSLSIKFISYKNPLQDASQFDTPEKKNCMRKWKIRSMNNFYDVNLKEKKNYSNGHHISFCINYDVYSTWKWNWPNQGLDFDNKTIVLVHLFLTPSSLLKNVPFVSQEITNNLTLVSLHPFISKKSTYYIHRS